MGFGFIRTFFVNKKDAVKKLLRPNAQKTVAG